MYQKEIEKLPIGFLFKKIQPLGDGRGPGPGFPA
jgi:hypothetical protein